MPGRRLRLSPTAITGLSILQPVMLSAVLAPVTAPHNPGWQHLAARNAPPARTQGVCTHHRLGTDRLGRDILSRIIHGARTSLITALLAAAGTDARGTLLGLMAGYAGRLAQNVIMRLVDIMLTVPFILLALVIITVLGPSVLDLELTFIAVRWVQVARIAYANTLDVKERDVVKPARTSGGQDERILQRLRLRRTRTDPERRRVRRDEPRPPRQGDGGDHRHRLEPSRWSDAPGRTRGERPTEVRPARRRVRASRRRPADAGRRARFGPW